MNTIWDQTASKLSGGKAELEPAIAEALREAFKSGTVNGVQKALTSVLTRPNGMSPEDAIRGIYGK